jgi:hypothetical protein
MCHRSLGKSAVTSKDTVSSELTVVEVDMSYVEGKMLGCLFTALYHL